MVNRLDGRRASSALLRWAQAMGVLALVLIALSPAHLLAQAPDPVDRLRDLVAAERYAEAVTYADEVLATDPDNSRVAFWRDRAQSRLSGEADEHRVTTIERNAPPVRRPSTESLAPMTPAAQPSTDTSAQPPAQAPAQQDVAALPPPPPPPPPAPSGGIPKWAWIVAIAVVVVGAIAFLALRRGKGKAVPAAPAAKAAGLGAAAASMAPRRAPEPPPADKPSDEDQPTFQERDEDPQDNIHDAVTQAGVAAPAKEANEAEVSFNSLMFNDGEETLFGDSMGPAIQQSAATGAAPPAPAPAPAPAVPPPPPESYRSEPPDADAIVLGDPADLGDVDALDLGGDDDKHDDDGGETIKL